MRRAAAGTLGAVVVLGIAVDQARSQSTAEVGMLEALEGSWTVRSERGPIGTAEGRWRVGGRFLELEVVLEEGKAPVGHTLYLLGFDHRHGEHTVVLMDDSDSYWVSARGTAEGDRIAMYGTDRDPVMESMGFTKEFVIEIRLGSTVALETRFIDTRTEERNEIPFLELLLEHRP